MDKAELLVIMQICLFAEDGLTEKDIIDLNNDYDINLIQEGIKLHKFLRGKAVVQ